MQTIQPLQLSLLTKNFHWEDKDQLVITTLLGFPLSGGRPLLEADLWTRLSEALGDNILDMGMPKPNGEVLVYANYYSPDGEAITAGRTALSCGNIDKELAVIGNRHWRSLIGPSPPEAFTRLPLSYEFAFGGQSYIKNTLGKGIEEAEIEGELRVPLPNIEYPEKLVTSQNDRPEPAGFGPLDIMWQQRLQRAGTYDQKWIEQIAPGYPLDINWNYFNCAPEDQWIESFWQGDEHFTLENMHPNNAVIEGTLPNFRARAFILPKHNESDELKEVSQRLETILFFPDLDLGVLLWRGTVEVEDDDLSDIEALLTAFEDGASAPLPVTHYQQSYLDRQDEDRRLKYLNFTEDLIPPQVPCGHRYVTLTEDDMAMPMLENMFAGADESKDEIIAQANQKKVDLKLQLEAMKDQMPAAEYQDKIAELEKPIEFPRFEVPDKVERLKIAQQELLTERVDFEKLEKDIAKQIQDGKDLAREKLEETQTNLQAGNADPETLATLQQAKDNLDLPPLLPRPFVDEIRVQLDEQLAEIAKHKKLLIDNGGDVSEFPGIDTDLDSLFIKFKQLEAMQKEGYRISAHDGEPGRHPHTRPLSDIRNDLLEAYQKGESLKGRDFACIDLSNQNLTGIDLEGAYLEQVNFSGAVLDDANLNEAILAGANLSRTSLKNAELIKANLGKIDFSESRFKNTNLKQAIFDQSHFHKSILANCDLSEASFTNTTFSSVDFSHSAMNFFNVSEQDLSSCLFNNCELNEASFNQCRLNHVNFKNAIMVKTSFTKCQGEKINFSGANLENGRFHENCDFPSADFSNACLQRAVFQQSKLEGSTFDEADFFMADFSRSSLQRASFHRAIGKKAQFVKSDLGSAKMTSMNLMEGSLLKARLTLADFSNSNLYAVEFIDAIVGETDFSGANLDMSKLQDWHP